MLALVIEARKRLASECQRTWAHRQFEAAQKALPRLERLRSDFEAMRRAVYQFEFKVRRTDIAGRAVELLEELPTKRSAPGAPWAAIAEEFERKLQDAGLPPELAREALVIAAVRPYPGD